MKKIFIHIGYHKTGTSALQYFFWKNRERFLSHGYLYPETGRNGTYSHGELANIIKPNNRDNRLPEYQERFHKEAELSEASNLLLSSEVFLEGINVAGAVRRFIDDQMFEVKIIMYLRNQVDWIESVYNEVIRDPYRRYTGDILKLREYVQEMHDYEKIVDMWVDAFGHDAIIINPYGGRSDKMAIYHDFLKILGIEDWESFDYKVDTKHENMRFHPLAIEFLRRLNRFAMMQDEYFMVMEDVASVSGLLMEKYDRKKYSATPPEIRESIMQRFREKNRALFLKYSNKDTTLFDGYESDKQVISSQASLDADAQHLIFDNMSEKTRRFLEGLIKPVRDRQPGKSFLNPPPLDIEKRLNEVIMRQRFELRKLYEKKIPGNG